MEWLENWNDWNGKLEWLLSFEEDIITIICSIISSF